VVVVVVEEGMDQVEMVQITVVYLRILVVAILMTILAEPMVVVEVVVEEVVVVGMDQAMETVIADLGMHQSLDIRLVAMVDQMVVVVQEEPMPLMLLEAMLDLVGTVQGTIPNMGTLGLPHKDMGLHMTAMDSTRLTADMSADMSADVCVYIRMNNYWQTNTRDDLYCTDRQCVSVHVWVCVCLCVCLCVCVCVFVCVFVCGCG